ncbi:unnamed protein product [Closterium sp. Naga37s-1]|nr:unnamed protein product [Closterium sp. Naga37s-1]
MTKRFRLRNGREILEERAFLVGVEILEERAFLVGVEILEERAFLVGVEVRSAAPASPSASPSAPTLFPIEESRAELSQLVETAGLKVVGTTHQRVASPNPRTYIGAGKVEEVRAAVSGMGVETVVFDDELSAGQLRNLEKEFGGDVRVCDRTALIIDIFSQRANTKEAALQVQLAQLEYQLPRLTRMWTHLERQAGGMVKGMGEKQIEVDKRIIRERMAALRRSLTSVREHRQQHRDRRAGLPIPVLSLVGYTNAGKSTLLNRLTGAGVLAEDKLFATLDPTTRRTQLPNGKECLLTDTVGFIQKLPTQLVAAFRATLEEITEASVLLHVVDVSHPMAAQQVAAVLQVLAELEVSHIPMITVLNKVDQVSPDWLQQQQLQLEAILDQNSGGRESSAGGRESSAGGRDGGGREGGRHRMVAVSAVTGEGMDGLFHELEKMVNGLLVSIEAIIPYQEGHLLGLVYQLGAVDREVRVVRTTWGGGQRGVGEMGAVARWQGKRAGGPHRSTSSLPVAGRVAMHPPFFLFSSASPSGAEGDCSTMGGSAAAVLPLHLSPFPPLFSSLSCPSPTQEHLPEGTLLSAHVPLRVAQLLLLLPYHPHPLPPPPPIPPTLVLPFFTRTGAPSRRHVAVRTCATASGSAAVVPFHLPLSPVPSTQEHLPEGTLLSAHEHLPEGTLLSAHVPLGVAQLLFCLFICPLSPLFSPPFPVLACTGAPP